MKKKDLLYPYPESKPKLRKTSRKGIRDDEIMVCYIVNVELLKKVKALAYWERSTMRKIAEKAITDYVYRKGSTKLKNPFQENNENDEKGTTFVIKEEIANKVKALAYWESGTIKGIFNKALKTYINKYESKNGIIEPKPKKR